MKKILISTILFVLMFQGASAVIDFGFLAEVTATNYLPSTIHAGDIVSVAIDVKNRGNAIPIENLVATLDIGTEFEGLDLVDEVELIKPQATTTIIFRFRVNQNAVPTYYSTFLTLDYLREGKPVSEKRTISIPVSLSNRNLEVSVEPKVVNPSIQTKLFFTLKNVGGTSISNLSFSWSEENNLILPLGSDNKKYISLVTAGESVTIQYNVAADPNIAPGIYPIDLTMSYNDANGTRTQTSTVGLLIGGETDFEVSAETLSSGQLSITIANIGTNNAEAVVVKILQQQGISISGSNIEILGNLDKGDFTIANFETSSESFASGTQTTGGRTPGFGRLFSNNRQQNQQNDETNFRRNISASELKIEIDYTDTTGERRTVGKTIALSQDTSTSTRGFERQGPGIFGLISWVLLVLIVGGALVYNKFKAKKDWKSLGKILAGILVLFLITIFLLGSNLIPLVLVTIFSLIVLVWVFSPEKLNKYLAKLKK